MLVFARGAEEDGGDGTVVVAASCGVEADVWAGPAAPVALATSAAASPADIAPAMIPTALRRVSLALVAVGTARGLAVTVVPGLDVLGRSSQAPPSRFPRTPGH